MKSLFDAVIKGAGFAIIVLAALWLLMMLMSSSMGWGGRNSGEVAVFVIFGLLAPMILTGFCVWQTFKAVDLHQRERSLGWLFASVLPIPSLYLLFEIGVVF